jgi:hypothetical protein
MCHRHGPQESPCTEVLNKRFLFVDRDFCQIATPAANLFGKIEKMTQQQPQPLDLQTEASQNDLNMILVRPFDDPPAHI